MSHIVKIKLYNGASFNVPADLSEKLKVAHACMQQSGRNCNASWEGFEAGSEGKTHRDNPYSIITNIIENRRWAAGLDDAVNSQRRKVRVLGGKGNFFLKCKDSGEILGEGFRKIEEALNVCTKNRWYSC